MPESLVFLKRRDDYVAVASFGRKSVMPGFILQARQRPSGNLPSGGIRVGITATRKIGGAVVRNRAKRRLRALSRELMPENAMSGHDFVLIARGTTPAIPYASLRADLLQALRKLGLLNAGGSVP